MGELIKKMVPAIKSTYVDSRYPNSSFSNETNILLIGGMHSITEGYIGFNKADLDSVPEYATDISLMVYAEYLMKSSGSCSTYVYQIYKLNSEFNNDTTYNTRPDKTLVSTPDRGGYNSWIYHLHLDNLKQFYNGICITGYGYYDDPKRGEVRGVKAVAGRPYISYEYTKNDLDVTVQGNSIDSDITVNCTIDSVDELKGTIKAYQNGKLISTKTIECTNTATFEAGTFGSIDDITFESEVYKPGVLYTGTTVLTGIINTSPIITSLEPDSVQKLRSNPIDVTFSGKNISSWSLSVSQCGVVKHSDSGTDRRTSTVQANVLTNGLATITLTSTYQGAGYTTTSTRTSAFTVYGKPNQPSFNIESSYNTPRPLFAWSDNQEQVAWKLIIETSAGEEVVNTGEQYGTVNSYQSEISLVNGTYYVAKLQIKNQYDLWSDIVSGTFLVTFATLNAPVFTIYADNENATNVLVIESEENASFSKHIVYRRKTNDIQWIKIADNVARVQTIEDCECGANIPYEYKVSSVSDIDAHTDSEIKTITCNFHNTHISVANTNDKVILNMEVESDVSYTDDITFELYDGQDKPDSSSSGLAYATLTVSAEVETEAYNKLMRYWKEPLLCLRDRSGLLLYGRITQPQVNFKCYGVYNVSFTFTECYNEEVDLNGTDEYRYCYFIECEW